MLFQNNATNTMTRDAGLAAHMRQIFNYMTGGVAISGLVAWFTLRNPEALNLALHGQMFLLIAWFAMGVFFHKIAFNTQPVTALAMFALYSALTGFMLAPLGLMYAKADLTLAFFSASGVFLASSLYGYMTGKSLSGLGSFLAVGGMGLMAFAVVLIVWSFFGAPPQGLSLFFSLLVVPFVTIGIAFKTNQIRETYHMYGGNELTASRIAIMSALSFYTDFVVLFIHILNIIGASRR